MTLRKVMLIRHAEKPNETVQGVNEAGRADSDQLSVRGWQRAGALVRFFAPIGQDHRSGICTPTAIFACKPYNPTRSLRPLHTVSPLATALGITVRHEFARGDDASLVDAVLNVPDAALICWQHEPIPGIARKITGNLEGIPEKWPARRFDLIWILDRIDDSWRFSQIDQMLLPGDVMPG
jgi:broad specificity phosphatase PhoE